jgi:predicted metal-dependent hydrolase
MKGATFSGKHSIVHGNRKIVYSLFTGNRKTMEIAVHPDSSVIVNAPENSDIYLIESKLHKRARWILRQLNYFRQFEPRTPARSYVNGETHLYLGRKYRLKIVKGLDNTVKLSRGYLNVCCADSKNPQAIKKILERWYLEKAEVQFKESMDRCWQTFSVMKVRKPVLKIRGMKRRWGSLSEKRVVTLNTDLIKAPRECIDYVITHELCHLKYHSHNSDFYRLLDSIFPDWEKIKHRLELGMI